MFREAKNIQSMEYRAVVASGLMHEKALPDTQGSEQNRSSAERADLEARIKELSARQEQSEKDFQFRLNAVRKEAYEAGRRSAESEHTATLETMSGRVAEMVDEFRLSRDLYLAQVEREVVRLSLSIAERILHRQAQMDPLLLSGAVRVALGQLAESTEVRLRVPLGEQKMWEEMLRLMPNLPLRPELAVDERMSAGECTIETHLGSVDIGVRAQLAEIERGFFDLLGHRGQVTNASQVVDGK